MELKNKKYGSGRKMELALCSFQTKVQVEIKKDNSARIDQ
jgi:hypothetical protein